ncbi:MAG: biosynthetic-type acetolactate synthase large subunit [bacterium]
MKHSGAEIIIQLIERQGITTVAGIPGGCNLPIYDAIHRSAIRHILTRHEQGAAFVAQGMSRVSGKAAVCLGTSGPGATNLVTAIADAKLDSIPMVAITGQVPSSLLGTDAFQEVDTYGMTMSITKHNFLVQKAEDLLEIIPKAFEIAESGRPGPVLVDVPKDVQLQEVEFDHWPEPFVKTEPSRCSRKGIEGVAQMIRESKRPVFYIGGGIIAANASEELARVARKNSIPVTATLMALGAFPSDDPLFLGMLGMHGPRYTNYALEEADLLLAFGARFDDRATGKVAQFCPNAKIAHVDIDASEIHKIKTAHLPVTGDVRQALRQLEPLVEENDRAEWNARIRELKEAHPFEIPEEARQPLRMIAEIGKALDPEDIVATDVGQHQMWTAQAYPFSRPRKWLTSGGLGTMGFGLPSAIGAALAAPDRTVLCVSGDGSILMNIQEFATLADLGLNVKVLIMNNGALGLVRQQQELFYGAQYSASQFQTHPDFAGIARHFHLPSIDLTEEDDPATALIEAMSKPGPCIINAPIPAMENVFPMVPPGGANREMIGGEKKIIA